MNLFSTPTMFLRRTNLPPLCGEYGRYNEAIHLKTRPVRRERKKKKIILPAFFFLTELKFLHRADFYTAMSCFCLRPKRTSSQEKVFEEHQKKVAQENGKRLGESSC